MIKKLELHLLVVPILLKIKFDVPKISIQMSKTACINLWLRNWTLILHINAKLKCHSWLIHQLLTERKYNKEQSLTPSCF